MSSDLHANADHEKFRELCALAASGGLTADEAAELKAHLEQCECCRERLAQYRALGTKGLPALAAGYSQLHESPAWDDSLSWKKLLARLCADRAPSGPPAEDKGASGPGLLRRIRANWFKRARSKKPSASTK